jgi:hypothetical protein
MSFSVTPDVSELLGVELLIFWIYWAVEAGLRILFLECFYEWMVVAVSKYTLFFGMFFDFCVWDYVGFQAKEAISERPWLWLRRVAAEGKIVLERIHDLHCGESGCWVCFIASPGGAVKAPSWFPVAGFPLNYARSDLLILLISPPRPFPGGPARRRRVGLPDGRHAIPVAFRSLCHPPAVRAALW